MVCGGGLFFTSIMPKLFFRHSYIYEKLLSNISRQTYRQKDFNDAQKITKAYAKHWGHYENQIFRYFRKLGLIFPDFWIVYLIRSKKNLTPFSDPLTVLIDKNLEKSTFIIIHELCHVFLTLSVNEKHFNKFYSHLKRVFPKNSLSVNVEIITVLIARGVITKIFGNAKADNFVKYERHLPILKQAWKSIYTQPGILQEDNPIKAILSLK
jgi:hypothetical protein